MLGMLGILPKPSSWLYVFDTSTQLLCFPYFARSLRLLQAGFMFSNILVTQWAKARRLRCRAILVECGLHAHNYDDTRQEVENIPRPKI